VGRLSIGLRWTLRYTAATMLVVLALSFVYYKLVEVRVRADAQLVLELQANELAEAVERQAGEGVVTDALVAYVDQHLDSAQGDLRLGIRVVDPDGRPLLERGVFEQRAIPLPTDFRALAASRRIVEIDVGESFPYAVITAPIEHGYVEVAVSTRRFLRGIRDLRNSFLQVLPAALLATGVLGWWLARSSLAPISRMTEAARRISASQLDERIPTSGARDELDALALTLNAMMERVGAGVERIRSFSSTAAHQLRTPLSLLRSRLEIASLSERDPEADQALLSGALRDVERLGDAVRGMLRLSDSEGGLRPEQRRPVELRPLLEEVVDFFEPVASEKGLDLRLSAEGEARVVGDVDWLRELFSNLVDNAVKYTPPGGRVEVALASRGGEVEVAVHDTGPGIPDRDHARVFERFERGAAGADVQGVGLGLTIAREIALTHGGSIRVASRPGKGSVFTACLPRHDGAAASPRARD
jgi:heavy metal sensor kinase